MGEDSTNCARPEVARPADLLRSRVLWLVAIAAVLFLLSAISVLSAARATGAMTFGANLVAIREATFARFVEIDDYFRRSPSDLIKNDFLIDALPLPDAEKWRNGVIRRILTHPEGDDVPARLRSMLAEVHWRAVKCASGASLTEKAKLLAEGRTCCSDNVELLLAQAALEGVLMREVHATGHVVAEVFLPDQHRWVFLDPSYSVIAIGPGGRTLSLLEVRAAVLSGTSVQFEFLWPVTNGEAIVSPSQLAFYDSPEDFNTISIVLGNNVFSVDRFRNQLQFLPEPVRQGLGLVLGVYPQTAIFMDRDSTAGALIATLRQRLVWLAFTAMSLLVVTSAAIRNRRQAS